MLPVPVLCGPTACGKTALAVHFFSGAGEAVSADCMQIYRRMDIGTAKPTPAELAALPHHLVDIREPDQTYSAGDFFRDAVAAIEAVRARGLRPVVVGGTGLYLKTLVTGFFDGPPADPELRAALTTRECAHPGSLHAELRARDPRAAARISPHDVRRTIRALEVAHLTGSPISELQEARTVSAPCRFRIAAIIQDREVLQERIRTRVREMFRRGLLEETRALLDAGYPRTLPSMLGLGYRHAVACLLDGIPAARAEEELIRDTVAFARRQILLFKKIPGLVWFHADDRTGLERYFSGTAAAAPSRHNGGSR